MTIESDPGVRWSKILHRYQTDPSSRDLFWVQLDLYLAAGGHITDVSVTARPLKPNTEIQRLHREIIDLKARLDLAESSAPHEWGEFWFLAGKKRYTTLALLAEQVGKSSDYLKECRISGYVPAILFHLLRHSPVRPLPVKKVKPSDPSVRAATTESRAVRYYPEFRAWALAKEGEVGSGKTLRAREYLNVQNIDQGLAASLVKLFNAEFPDHDTLFELRRPAKYRKRRQRHEPKTA